MGFDSKESIVSELADAIAEEEDRRAAYDKRYKAENAVRLRAGLSSPPGYQGWNEYRQWKRAIEYRKSCEQAIADWDKPREDPVHYGHR